MKRTAAIPQPDIAVIILHRKPAELRGLLYLLSLLSAFPLHVNKRKQAHYGGESMGVFSGAAP